MANLLRLGKKKNKRINSFVLLSTFSNFAASNAASLLVLGNSNHLTINNNEI